MRRAFAALALVLLVTAPAAAQNVTPLQLYQTGKYDEAIKAGLGANNADGFAIAARAELAEEMMREAPCLDCLKRAEGYARKAIAADPKQAEGRIYLAAALGYQTRIIGLVAAKFEGFAGEAKSNLDVALANHPDDPWVLAAMGGWNIAVVKGGGATLAAWLYNASTEQGLKDFAKAMTIDPQNIAIRFQYALSLSAFDREIYAKEIRAALQATVSGRPQTAYETIMQGWARKLLNAFKQGDWKNYDALVRHYQRYPSS